MLRDNMRNNYAEIIGKLVTPPVFVCEHKGRKYYDGLVRYNRQSGRSFDLVPITTNEETALAFQELCSKNNDEEFLIVGPIVSRGNNLRAETALEYPMAISVDGFCVISGGSKPTNEVEIKGYICENPICRVTPSGREICELTIAIPNELGNDRAQTYVKCITWNGTARFASRLYIGAFVEGLGRFQSRTYKKTLENGQTVTRNAYEVSLYVMADGRG